MFYIAFVMTVNLPSFGLPYDLVTQVSGCGLGYQRDGEWPELLFW